MNTGGQSGDGVLWRHGAVGGSATVVSRAGVDDGRVVRVEQLHVRRAVGLEGVSVIISEKSDCNRQVIRLHVEDGVVHGGLGDLMLGEGVVHGSCKKFSGTASLGFFVVGWFGGEGNISRQTPTAR
jgi:hypothetical protein